MTHVPSLTLNNGVKIPAVGLGGGTYHPAERAVAKDWFLTALEAGYRLVDVAQIYGKCTATTGLTHETYLPSLETEEALGQAIKASGIPREELFITTKIPAGHHSRVVESFQESLKNLALDYVDLYLIHWPFPFEYEEGEFYPKHPDGSIKLAKSPSFVELWAEIEKLLDTGKVRAIGVCNFSIKNLEILLKSAKVVPAVNQFELHPYLAQTELVEYCKRKGIVVEAYTPTGYQKVLADPTINELAVKYSVSAAQVVLAWHLACGCIPIPKSSNKDRQNYIDGWVEQLPTLEPSDIIKISALDKGERICAKLDENGTLFGATAEQLGW
ncbi:NADP-dependent oxidoreductase domain superfamily protein [Pleurotus pulmonarius]